MLNKEYIIISAGKEVFKSAILKDALSEYSKNKYLLGFETIRTALKEDTSDKRILTYIKETPPEELKPDKLTKVLVERVNTRVKRQRSQLIYRYSMPEDAESSGS